MTQPIPSDDDPLREVERNIWRELFEDSPAGRKMRAESRKDFNRFFPAGHRTVVDNIFRDLVDDAKAGKEFEYPYAHLNDVHQRAWDIILKHGKHYRPTSWRDSKPWEWDHQPLGGSCFLNAIEMIWFARQQEPKTRAVYVEGFALGPHVDPMLHAWNGTGFAGVCIDWSFYATTMYTRYFGIPFTFEEYEYINPSPTGESFSVRLMFRRDQFEKVEDRIHEVLKKPRTRLMRSKAA